LINQQIIGPQLYVGSYVYGKSFIVRKVNPRKTMNEY